METNNIEETAKKYAEEKGKGEFGLVYSAFKQGAGWMETMVMRENEELKATLETYRKEYKDMIAEVLRLSGENSKMKQMIADRIKELE